MDADHPKPSGTEQTAPEDIADLKSLLQAEQIGYTNLLAILGQEKQFLIQRDFDAFASVLEEKHRLVNQLDQLAGHRMTVLAALKLEGNEAGMQAWLNRQPEFGREALHKSWIDIKGLVRQCNQKNEVNAKIAHRAQTTSRRVLNILKGAPMTDPLYDKRGQADGNGSGLSISEA